MAADGRYQRLLAVLSSLAIAGALWSLAGGPVAFTPSALGNASYGACCFLNDSCSVLGKFFCEQANGTFSVQETCDVCSTKTATATATATATGTATATPTHTPVPQGGACMSGSQCQTTFCVDGVCCDLACDAPGQTCNAAGVCIASAAAPAASRPVLGLAIVLLSAIAAVALTRRRRARPPER